MLAGGSESRRFREEADDRVLIFVSDDISYDIRAVSEMVFHASRQLRIPIAYEDSQKTASSSGCLMAIFRIWS
jgi:hypothetical protein